MGVSALLTIDWQPIAGCPSWWFPRARAGGRRGAAAHSASLCCRWWSPRPGGEKLAWGTGSLQHHQRQQTNSEDVRTSPENNYVYVPLLPSIAGMSPWSLALLVKGAFSSTTANRGGMRDCRADRNMWSLCSSRPCSPCYRKHDGRLD